MSTLPGPFTPPPRPRRMSERRYRELHDSDPHTVYVRPAAGTPVRIAAAGLVSGCLLANTHAAQPRTQVALLPAAAPPPDWWPRS